MDEVFAEKTRAVRHDRHPGDQSRVEIARLPTNISTHGGAILTGGYVQFRVFRGGCFSGIQSGYRHKDAQIRYKGLKRTKKPTEIQRKRRKNDEN